MVEHPEIEEDNGPDTYVSNSTIIDELGLFASRDFEVGEIIIDYNLFPQNWYNTTYEALTEEQIKMNWYVMIDQTRCMTNDKYSKFSFINHSRTPNCVWLINNKLVTSARNIKKDEELFIDYRIEPRPNREEEPSWI